MKDQSSKLQKQLEDVERANRLQKISSFSASYYVAPLFLLFGIMDYIYYPKVKYLFWSLRVLTVVSIVILNKIIQRVNDLEKVQRWTTLFVSACSLPLIAMLLLIDDLGSPYYAGLNLVIIGMSSGFRFTTFYYYLNLGISVLPPILFGFMRGAVSQSSFFELNMLFLIGTALISTVSRYFNEALYLKEFNSRNALSNELANRELIINQKTKEALDLKYLSRQFSPQVVKAIQDGQLDIKRPVHRAEIAAIFIDIVGSTDRFIRLDREDLNKILSMFIDDTMSTLLKYDLTIDKFLGDGVLAFSNDPMKHSDFVPRTLVAAQEILNKIKQKQDSYDELWMAKFQVRCGIASGYASVGFYGSDKNFKSYTAIGRPINLASRLTSAATENTIVVSSDIVTKCKETAGKTPWTFQFTDLGYQKLKGFESDDIKVYRVQESQADAIKGITEVCPNGHSDLFLDVDEKGFYYFSCRVCAAKIENTPVSRKAA